MIEKPANCKVNIKNLSNIGKGMLDTHLLHSFTKILQTGIFLGSGTLLYTIYCAILEGYRQISPMLTVKYATKF